MSKTGSKPKPRFRRVPGPPLKLQPRDTQIISAVAKHRFLSSNHIISLITGSRQAILRRLQRLFHAGYLDRPREQIKLTRIGSEPMVHGLGNNGAGWLKRETGFRRGQVDWTGKNRDIRQRQLDHTLMVSEFMVCLELACRDVKGVRLIESEQILANRRLLSKNTNNPNSWQVRVNLNGKDIAVSLIPDKIFGLHFQNARRPGNRKLFFLEADRSTMPIKRNSPYQSSFFKKIIGYWESWQQSLYQAIFGYNAVQVLTITKSQERINHMIKACKEADRRRRGSPMFLFAQAKEFNLQYPHYIFEEVWQNGLNRELLSMLR